MDYIARSIKFMHEVSRNEDSYWLISTNVGLKKWKAGPKPNQHSDERDKKDHAISSKHLLKNMTNG